MPIINITRDRSQTSDQNQIMFNSLILDTYLQMGLINQKQRDAAKTEKQVSELVASVPDMTDEQAAQFASLFVPTIIDGQVNTNSLLEFVPPATLAYAYDWARDQAQKSNDDKYKKYVEVLENRMDDLSDQFADNFGYFVADQTNIADVAAGYEKMFDARSAALDPQLASNAEKINKINENKQRIAETMGQYDKYYGIENLAPRDAANLQSRYDNATKTAESGKFSDEAMGMASRYKFLNKEGNAIPQFIDGEGNKVANYESGYEMDPDGRLHQISELARQNVAMRHLMDEAQISDDELTQALDDELFQELFEMNMAGRVADKVESEPVDYFADPSYLEQFKQSLTPEGNGGAISETGYQAALDAQVNKVAGWAGRIKQKIKGKAEKATGFFKKVFKPVEKIDKLAAQRAGAAPKGAKLRSERIKQLKNILKGFGSAALVSATLTTIATAAAATAGVSVAATMAALGIGAAGITTGIQIHKWRKDRKANGLTAGIKDFFKDKRMLTTVATTVVAGAAMGCGAAGLSTVAKGLGLTALAMGGIKNTVTTYRDLKARGMGTAETILWSAANAGAVIAGGLTGRLGANAAISAYNEAHPTNTIFQQETHDTIEHTTVHEEYTDDALKNAKRIAEMWYRDNPAELQHRVDMINQYNAENGTHIDPYRAIVINADAGGHTFDNMALHVDGGGHIHSGGQHTVLTPKWGAEHGFTTDELSAMRNMFTPDGHVNPAAIDAAIRADHHISPINEVGAVSSGDAPHYDGVLPQNTVDANGTPVFNTYTDGNSAFQQISETTLEDITNYTPVQEGALGMFGTYTPKETVKDQNPVTGSLADKITEHNQPRPEPRPLPPAPNNDDRLLPPAPNNDDRLLPPAPNNDDRLLPPAHTDEDASELLAEEYNKFHGRGTWDRLTPEQQQRYEDMVRADLAKEPDAQKYKSLNDYIWQRLFDFDDALRLQIDPLGQKSNKANEDKLIAETRQEVWKSNANINNLTLQDFQQAVKFHTANDHSRDVIRMSQDPTKGHLEHKRKDTRFKRGTYALNAKIEDYEEILHKQKDLEKQIRLQQLLDQKKDIE